MFRDPTKKPETHLFLPQFKYKHENPYHDKLEIFHDFVLRDEEAEVHRGKWSENVFQRVAPLEVEIGTGYGHFMIEHCEKNPDINFIGLDFRFKRSFQLAKRLSKVSKQNFRYLRGRGERIEYIFDNDEIDKLYYFFPDPWPKTRHHKKRLFQKPFLKAAHKVIKSSGRFFIKTDHDEYFEWMVNELKDQNLFEVEFLTRDLYSDSPDHFLASFQTKFEKIFLKQKIKIKAMVLRSLK